MSSIAERRFENPYFLCAGPARTGSTWLYRMCKRHPHIKMPTIKEIDYFYNRSQVGPITLRDKLYGTHPKHLKRRQAIKRNYRLWRKRLRKRNNPILQTWWFLRFEYDLLRTETYDWYLSLFLKDAISGDISPQYASLNDEEIAFIRDRHPNIKVIIGIRDPIDRRVSHMNRMISRETKRLNKENPDADIADQLDLAQRYFHNHFKTNSKNVDDPTFLIEKWHTHFPAEQILVYYFDELEQNPQQLFDKICDFLNVERFTLPHSRKINSFPKQDFPEEVRRQIVQRLHPLVEKHATIHPNKYSLAWQEKYSTPS